MNIIVIADEKGSDYAKMRGQLRHELSQVVETFGYDEVFRMLITSEWREYPDDSINALNLSARAYNCLKYSGIHTLDALMKILDENPEGLLRLRNFGRGLLKEVIEKTAPYREAVR
jgi:DNA-directed RNA polymerase alpha subunit